MKSGSLQNDPVAYRISYSRAAALLHVASTEGDGERSAPTEQSKKVRAAVMTIFSELPPPAAGMTPNPPAQEAATTALKLIHDAERELLRLGRRWVGRKPSCLVRKLRGQNGKLDRRLAAFLDQVLEPAAILLHLSSQVELDHAIRFSPNEIREPPKKALKRVKPKDKDKVTDLDAEWVREYVAQLAAKQPPEPHRLKRVCARLGVTRWRRPAPTDPRVRYNLACFFSRLSSSKQKVNRLDRDDLQKLALDQLRQCLDEISGKQRVAMKEWANCDPGLSALSQTPAFLKIIKPSDVGRESSKERLFGPD